MPQHAKKKKYKNYRSFRCKLVIGDILKKNRGTDYAKTTQQAKKTNIVLALVLFANPNASSYPPPPFLWRNVNTHTHTTTRTTKPLI